MTGHGYLCLDDGHEVPRPWHDLASDGFGGLSDPRVVTALAGPQAAREDIDSLDVLLVSMPTAGRRPTDRHVLIESTRTDHPRVEFARRLRDDVRVLEPATPSGDLAVIATGLAGLTEISLEVDPARRGHGHGTELVRSVLSELATNDRSPSEPVVAMVAPGNAASLRCLLAAGFTPVGSAQVWHRRDS